MHFSIVMSHFAVLNYAAINLLIPVTFNKVNIYLKWLEELCDEIACHLSVPYLSLDCC